MKARDLLDGLKRMREDNERLLAALVPLARLAIELPATLADDRPLYAYGSVEPLTAGDVRRAAAAVQRASANAAAHQVPGAEDQRDHPGEDGGPGDA